MATPEDGKFQDDVPVPSSPTGQVTPGLHTRTRARTPTAVRRLTRLTSQEEDDLRDLKEDPGVASSHRERRSVHSATPPLLTPLRSFCKKGVEN